MAARRNRGNQFLTVVTVLVVLGLLLLLYQQVRAFRRATARAAEEQLLLDQARARLQVLVQLKSRAAELENQKAVLQARLPADPGEDKLISELQSFADLAGMRFILIRFGERRPGDGYVEMPFTIMLEGRYHQLLDLLGYLQECDRAIRINELKLGQGQQPLPQLVVTIGASTFFSPK